MFTEITTSIIIANEHAPNYICHKMFKEHGGLDWYEFSHGS